MEITLGHKFKLECWETCLKTMRLGEIAKFSVDQEVIMILDKENNNICTSTCCKI